MKFEMEGGGQGGGRKGVPIGVRSSRDGLSANLL
jgi:hypothetical protein